MSVGLIATENIGGGLRWRWGYLAMVAESGLVTTSNGASSEFLDLS